jgi:hypothetical protein
MRHLLILIPLLAGCSLVDQTTFAPSPEAAPAAEAAAKPEPRLDPRQPLVTMTWGTEAPAYKQMLGYAVRAAEARSPTVQYDVISVVKDAAAVPLGTEHASDVMRTIMAERVPASRVHLGVRMEPAVPATQVRVYVR